MKGLITKNTNTIKTLIKDLDEGWLVISTEIAIFSPVLKMLTKL